MPWNTNIANRIRTAAGIPAQTPPPPTGLPPAQPGPVPFGGQPLRDYQAAHAPAAPSPVGPPPPAGGATGSGTAQDVNGRRQYWTGTGWHDTPSQAGIPTQPPAAPAGAAPPVPFGGQPLRDYQAAHAPAPSAAPAGPSPLVSGIQQMIGPQESDPYEAWKAGGRQGARPAGY